MPSKIFTAYVIARPGDIVYMECDHNLSDDQVQRLHAMLKRAHEGTGIKVVVLDTREVRVMRIEGKEDAAHQEAEAREAGTSEGSDDRGPGEAELLDGRGEG